MKVKFANKVFEVLYTKEVAGLTMYAVEDEPNHIDWLINVEVIDAEKKELKKIEQKPAWSEEDENMCINLIQGFEMMKDGASSDTVKAMYDKKIDWFKSIKDRILPQPRQEWSEEDKYTIDCLIDYLESELDSPTTYTEEDKEFFAKEISLLKSLRSQSHWKPTYEQIAILRDVASGAKDPVAYGATMGVIIQNLEQLKGK